MDLYREFASNYLPDLFNYAVAIVDRTYQIGSGVLVNVGGRHFIANARHCIEDEPRVMKCSKRLERFNVAAVESLRIIRKGWHETLDIGFLEIDDPGCAEIEAPQLCNDRIVDGMIHVVGHPKCLTYVDQARKEISLCAGAFSSTFLDEADEYFRLAYPEEGTKFDVETGRMVSSAFPVTPEGFSGGGCFGVTQVEAGDIKVVEYKLLGIQCSWHRGERWVKIVPIKHWRDLLQERGV